VIRLDPVATPASGWRAREYAWLHRGKRVIREDAESALAARLARDADVVLHEGPVHVATDGVRVELSGWPSGQSSLLAAAVSGAAWRSGRIGREPLGLPFGFGESVTGLHAAAAALAAVVMRRIGRSSPAVVSVSEVDVWNSMIGVYDLFNRHYGGHTGRGVGLTSEAISKLILLVVGQSRDGEVMLQVNTVEQLTRLRSVLGDGAQERYPTYRDALRAREAFTSDVRRWLADLTVDQVLTQAGELGVVVTPLARIPEVVEKFEPDLFVPAPPSSGLSRWTRTPWGAPGRSSEPQRIVEASADVSWAPRGPHPTPPSGPVIEFGWNWTGPMIGQFLADLGFDVIRVESRTRLDPMRRLPPPTLDGVRAAGPAEELNPYYRQLNAGKRSITVDIKTPGGHAFIHRMTRDAALVVNNLGAGVLAHAGLTTDVLRQDNPNLVTVALPVFAPGHRYEALRGYAPVFTALGGLEALAGYPDEVTGVLSLGLGDPNGAIHGLVTALAALLGGGGRDITISQAEAVTWQLVEPLCRYLGPDHEVVGPSGNRDGLHVPQGIYACAEEDFVALCVRDADGWQHVWKVIGRPDLREALPDPANQDRYDHAISAWTGRHSLAQVVRDLSVPGVEVAEVLNPEQAAQWALESGLAEAHVDDRLATMQPRYSMPWRFDGEFPARRWSDTTLGWATNEVAAAYLSSEEIQRLRAEGALR
jgi:crotonobetainyl-CoA:carnitine CoA-transferase CaiB-like acyl-CoA transferase